MKRAEVSSARPAATASAAPKPASVSRNGAANPTVNRGTPIHSEPAAKKRRSRRTNCGSRLLVELYLGLQSLEDRRPSLRRVRRMVRAAGGTVNTSGPYPALELALDERANLEPSGLTNRDQALFIACYEALERAEGRSSHLRAARAARAAGAAFRDRTALGWVRTLRGRRLCRLVFTRAPAFEHDSEHFEGDNSKRGHQLLSTIQNSLSSRQLNTKVIGLKGRDRELEPVGLGLGARFAEVRARARAGSGRNGKPPSGP